ncbi:MAG TPA: ArsA-related P-loop ATPase [Candidatus Binataceae bacterium]|nr:ArsA-related P-loop ATPase [Candidatus Binataceae bacterium]
MRTETTCRSSIKLPQVIFVTGKGGTGKSTVAVALALALSRARAVTLVELDPRRSSADGGGPASPLAGGNFEYRALTARAELQAFIERIVPLRAISRRLLQSRTFGLVAAALPGLEAFLMLARIRLMAVAEHRDRTLVIDAAATGSALEMLSVADGVQRLAPFGTLNRLAAEVDEFIREGERFGVLLTLRAEELALREALAAPPALTALGIRCIGAVLNGATPALFSAQELTRLDGLEDHRRLAQARRTAAAEMLRAKRELRRAGLEVVTLPTLFRPALAQPEFEALADAFAASGIA